MDKMYQPITRKELQELKSKTDEINRVNIINSIVKCIYNIFIEIAKTQTLTSYNYRLDYMDIIVRNKINKINLIDLFYTYHDFIGFIYKNIDNIIIGLKLLFPDCAIKYKASSLTDVAAGNGPQEVEYKKLYKKLDVMYIEIDWS